jgi:hypothetical protein
MFVRSVNFISTLWYRRHAVSSWTFLAIQFEDTFTIKPFFKLFITIYCSVGQERAAGPPDVSLPLLAATKTYTATPN